MMKTDDGISFIAGWPTGTNGKSAVSDWEKDLRRRSLARFHELGIPGVRSEEWKYTNLSPVLERQYRLAVPKPLGNAGWLAPYIHAQDITLVMVNGFYSESDSRIPKSIPGVEITSLEGAFSGSPERFKAVLDLKTPHPFAA
jgi:Fe-S cluster assembly protein SufD